MSRQPTRKPETTFHTVRTRRRHRCDHHNQRRHCDPLEHPHDRPHGVHHTGCSRLAYTEALSDETAHDFARVLRGARRQRITPYTPRHNGKVERYNRILSEEFLYARTWTSENQRSAALNVWNVHYNYHRPHTAAGNRPPATRLHAGVTNVTRSTASRQPASRRYVIRQQSTGRRTPAAQNWPPAGPRTAAATRASTSIVEIGAPSAFSIHAMSSSPGKSAGIGPKYGMT